MHFKEWVPINRFNHTTCLFLSRAIFWISNIICQCVEMRGDCWFCWFGGIIDHQLSFYYFKIRSLPSPIRPFFLQWKCGHIHVRGMSCLERGVGVSSILLTISVLIHLKSDFIRGSGFWRECLYKRGGYWI